MSFGARLRQLRIGADLSMGEAARALGVSTVLYSCLENDKGAQITVIDLCQLLLRRACAAKHHPELARATADLERVLGAADACLLSRDASASAKRYARGVADVLTWLVGCRAECAFDLEALR